MTSKRTKVAIKKYGLYVCRMAYERNLHGDGPRNIGHEMGMTTRQADAAIDAGREIDAERLLAMVDGR